MTRVCKSLKVPEGSWPHRNHTAKKNCKKQYRALRTNKIKKKKLLEKIKIKELENEFTDK